MVAVSGSCNNSLRQSCCSVTTRPLQMHGVGPHCTLERVVSFFWATVVWTLVHTSGYEWIKIHPTESETISGGMMYDAAP